MKVSIQIAVIIFIFSTNYVLANQDIIVNNDEQVSDVYLHDYTNMWWQWAVSMNEKDSPVRDRTGSKCHVNQIGPVWFLAGGYGSSKINRKCSIPADKYIFFPVINMLYYPPNTETDITCASVKKGAALNNKHLTSFKVTIDEQQFLNPVFYKKSSKKCFDLIARKPNNTQKIEVYPSATDGYWLMLKPLPIGTHNISFQAEYNRPEGAYGKMVQDIHYLIEIVEP